MSPVGAAARVAAFLVVPLTGALIAGSAAAVSAGAAARPASPAAVAAPGWRGTFTGFPSADWASRWGLADEGSWGFDDMAAKADTTSPGSDPVTVTYGAGSSAHSCTDCPSVGGGEFYTLFDRTGHADWDTATTLDLKYALRFPTGFDFGKGGKLPGLFGGEIGAESGGVHGNGFSTRYMWRVRSGKPAGEVYFYSPTGSGFGTDLGLGKWTFAADGRWHAVEQRVDRLAQTLTVWYDGKQVFTTKVTGISRIPFSGVFFSTFFGGHEKAWGPKKKVQASFAAFSVSTSVQH